MASKYDLHWIRIKPGHYRLSNGNYDVRKGKDGWNVSHFDLWNGRTELIASGLPTCAEAKAFALRCCNIH